MDHLRNNFRLELSSVLALILIVFIGTLYLLLISFVITPQWRVHNQLAIQYVTAEAQHFQGQQAPVQAVEAEIATAEAELKDAAGMLFEPGEVDEFLKQVSQQASFNGVVIESLFLRPEPQTLEREGYEVVTFRLVTVGNSGHLMDFAALLAAEADSGLNVTNVNLSQGDEQGELALDLVFFTHPRASEALTTETIGTALPTPTLGPKDDDSIVGASPPIGSELKSTQTPLITPTATTVASPTATPTAEPTATPETTVYVVNRGDTLFSLARRFGTTVAAIQEANDLDGNNIRSGQTLIIPNP